MPDATVIALNDYPNYHRVPLDVEVTSEDGTWEASAVTVTGRVFKLGVWVDLPAFVLGGQVAADDVPRNYYSSAFGLREGATYPLEYTFTRIADDNGEVLERIVTSTTITTRTSPIARWTDICYCNPDTGNNSNSGATAVLAVESLREASFKGDRIVIVDGTYDDGDLDMDSASELWTPASTATAWDGSQSSYSIAPQTAGGVTITGARAMSGSWTRAAANIYYHTLTGFTKTGDATLGPGRLRRNTGDGSPEYLLLYNSVAHLTTGDWGEGFCIDWANTRIYVRTPSDVEPTTDQYVAAHPGRVMFLSGHENVVIEDINFEMAQAVDQTGNETSEYEPRGMIEFLNCTDIVFRRCNFTCAPILFQGGCTRITFEDCNFSGGFDPFSRFSLTPDNTEYNDFITDFGFVGGNSHALIAANAYGAGGQFVVRRCSLSKGWELISLANGTAGTIGNSDYYENTFGSTVDDCIDAGGGAGVSGLENSAIWHNTFTDFSYGVEVLNLAGGPMWIIANVFDGYLIVSIRKGTNVVAESAYGAGWVFVYDNTIHSDYVLEAATSGPTPWTTNNSQGNGRFVNNIFSGTGPNYTDGPTGDPYVWPETDPDVLFSNNSWYLTTPDAAPHVWSQTGYANEALMAAAVSDLQLQVTGNVYGTNPFLSGYPGPLNPAIAAATSISGITAVLADPNGMPFGSQPIPRGATNGFTGTGVLSVRPRRMGRNTKNRAPRLALAMKGAVAIT